MAKPGALIAVLAGGRGSRLGGAKPAAVLAGRPLIAHVLAAASESSLPTIVVAKADSAMPDVDVDVDVVLEADEPRHPLAGVLAALRFLPGAHDGIAAVLAVGCDMPFVNARLLRRLAAVDGAAALRVHGRLQPLPARYPLSGLASLQRSLDARRSMRDAISALDPHVLDEPQVAPFGEPEQLCFSVNDASDLRVAEAWLGARD